MTHNILRFLIHCDVMPLTFIIAVSQIGEDAKSAKFFHLDFGSNSIQPIADHPYGEGLYPQEGRAVGTFRGK